MQIVLTLIRIIAAILVPLLALVLSILTFSIMKDESGREPEPGQQCLRCGVSRIGANGGFNYLQDNGNSHDNPNLNQRIPVRPKFVLTEKHFICDHVRSVICATKYCKVYLWSSSIRSIMSFSKLLKILVYARIS